jgi:hypothetical protein
MNSAPENSTPGRREVAAVVLAVLSLLLFAAGVVVLGNLLSRRLPRSESAVESILPIMFGTTIVIMGAASSLTYVFGRVPRAWTVAVILNQLAVVATGLIAAQGAALLTATPASGCFAGLVNYVIFIALVVIPAVVVVVLLAAIGCLIASRPEPQVSIGKWVKLLAVGLAVLFVAASMVLVAGARNSPAGRYHALKQRTQNGSATIDELVDALKSPDINTRFVAVQELRKRGGQAKAAVPALAEALRDNQMVSWPAADALGNIGPDAAPAIQALVGVIVREQGIGKASETGSETPSTISWLAGRALAGIGSASVPALSKLLVHEDRFVRMTAAQALGTIGPPAEDAIPALNTALSDHDEHVRRLSRVALDRIETRRSGQHAPGVRAELTVREGGLPVRASELPVREQANVAPKEVQGIPIGVWTTLAPYPGDPRDRPPGTVLLSFQDGYRWLIPGSVERREQRADGDRRIEVVVSGSRRYEHVLETNEVRIIDDAAPVREDANSP